MVYKVVCDYISIYGFFVNIRSLKKANEIILYKAEGSLSDKFWITLLRFLNVIVLRKQITIETINVSTYFSLNPEVIEIIERNTGKINVDLVSVINRFLNGTDKDIIKYVKRSLIDVLQKKLYIRKQLEEDNKTNNYLIITDKNHFGIYNGLCDVFEDDYLLRNRLFVYIINICFAIFIFFKILLQFKLRYKINKKFHVDLLVQAQHFGYSGTIRRNILSEDYVFDKKRVSLLITNMWRPASSKETMKYKRECDEKGIRYVDVRDFCNDFQGIFVLIRTLVKYGIATDIAFRSRRDTYTYFLSLYQFLLETIYLRNYSCKAILCFDDYLALHIARTLIYRRYSIKTFGIQHSLGNGVHGTPSVAYVCFDKYLIWGNFFRELFAPFWDDVDTVKFSYNRIDNILRSREENDIYHSHLFSIIPRSRKKNIVITPPQFNEVLNPLLNSIGFIKFLNNLDGLILESCNVYIRPKTKDNITEFRQLINNDSIKFILNDNCTTTELLSIADLVIASAGSGVMCECALLRVKVICYDFLGCVKEYWMRFCSDVYCDSAESLYCKIKAFVNDEPLNVNWDHVWDEMVYPNEGNTNKIIQNLLDGTNKLNGLKGAY